MKTISRHILAAALLVLPVLVQAQDFNTGYFSKSYNLGDRINPAFAPRHSYIGFPALAGINVNLNSSLGISNILYPLESGRLGLFLHPEVPADVAMKSLKRNNKLDFSLDYDLLSAGWYTGKDTFWTLSVGLRVEECTNIPKDLFAFFKQGMTSDVSEYNIAGLSIRDNVYGRVSLGFSSELDRLVKGLRIGARASFLAGINSSHLHIDNARITMGTTRWEVNTKASGVLMGKGIGLTTDGNGVVNGFDIDPLGMLGLNGMGASLDIGVDYTLSEGTFFDGLRISLSALDLGFIDYDANVRRLKSAGNAVYSGFADIDLSNADFSGQLNAFKDDLLAMAQFTEDDAQASSMTFLGPKLKAGVQMPFLKGLMSLGVLYTHRFGKTYSMDELTVAYNIAPAKCFDFTVSYSMLNTFSSIGFLLNFSPRRGLNLFIGGDYIPLRYTPEFIPVDQLCANLQFGIAFPFGQFKN